MLETGQEIIIEITDFGINGEGIGKHEGFVVFVENAVPGDRAMAKIYDVKKNRALAKVLTLLEHSACRISPVCPSFGECGGCKFLHINYEAELEYKKKSVNDALRRIGGLDFEIDEIIGMDEPYFYRNKAVYHVTGDKNSIKTGFYGMKSRTASLVDKCVLFCEKNVKIIRAFERYMAESRVRAFDEKTGKGLIESLMVRLSSATGDYLVSVTASCKTLPNCAGLVYHLTESVPEIKGITQQGKGGGKTIWGDSFVIDKIGNYDFKISDSSFFQVNPQMTPVLYERIREFAALSKNETLVDAYSGVGSISIFLAEYAKEVIGIELSRQAVLDASENADLNKVSNIRFIQGDAGSSLNALLEELSPSAIILDPPRSGCSKEVILALSNSSPDRIVYVSCAPATMARDLKELSAVGFAVEQGVCVDMFPRCAHVECVMLLSRMKK